MHSQIFGSIKCSASTIEQRLESVSVRSTVQQGEAAVLRMGHWAGAACWS